MKIIALSIMMLLSNPTFAMSSSSRNRAPMQAKICGRYEVRTSVGMLQVLQPVLHVPSADVTGIETIYVLSNAGLNIEEVAARQAMIASMVEGENYCVTGTVVTLTKSTLQLTPESVEVAP